MPDAITRSEAAPTRCELQAPPCEECQGDGGWVRYEPGCEPAAGPRYLTCLRCRGSGRLLAA